MVYSILFLFAAAFRLPGLSTGSTFHEHQRDLVGLQQSSSSSSFSHHGNMVTSEWTLQRGEVEGVEAQEGRHPGNTSEEKRRVEATGGVSMCRSHALYRCLYMCTI